MEQTIQIAIPASLLSKLDERARNAGLKREEYASELISRELANSPTLDEILLPFRNQVNASGMTDDELLHLFQRAREEAYSEDKPA